MARIVKRSKKGALKRPKRGEKQSNDDASSCTSTGSIHRTTTILEMTRWQQEESSQETNQIEITNGNDSSDEKQQKGGEETGDESATLAKNDQDADEKQSTKLTTDVNAYMAQREMTETQERGNALTMIPSPLYCIYYILAGKWLANASSLVETLPQDEDFDDTTCIHTSWFPHLYTMPPLTVVFVALAIVVHAPFSFVYHWKYAPVLPAGIARTDHLSRRLDQAMIHFASALLSFATSASWEYFVANCLYNADCFRRQFHKEIVPRRNQIRIAVSMVFYTLPIALRDVSLFFECWAIILVSVWLFVRYPFGGWSHSAFHLVIALLPPLIMEAACQMSQDSIQHAAQCAAVSARNAI